MNKAPFSKLALGARFKYDIESVREHVYVKISHKEVAEWDDRMATSGWVAQGVFAFAEDDKLDTPVIVVGMTSIEAEPADDGGPAFPLHDAMSMQPANVGEWKRLASGMSMRDYFAAKAMQAQLSRMRSGPGDAMAADRMTRETAEYSYAIADAMLVARAVRS